MSVSKFHTHLKELFPAIKASNSHADGKMYIYNTTPSTLTVVCTETKHSAATVAASVGISSGVSFDLKRHQDSRSFAMLMPAQSKLCVPHNNFVSILIGDQMPKDKDHQINRIFQSKIKTATVTVKQTHKPAAESKSSEADADASDAPTPPAPAAAPAPVTAPAPPPATPAPPAPPNVLATLLTNALPPSLAFLATTEVDASVNFEAPQMLNYGDTESSSGLWYYKNYLVLSHCIQHSIAVLQRKTEGKDGLYCVHEAKHALCPDDLVHHQTEEEKKNAQDENQNQLSLHSPPLWLLTCTPEKSRIIHPLHKVTGAWIANNTHESLILAVSTEKPMLNELKLLLSITKLSADVDISEKQFISYYSFPARTAFKIRQECWITVFDLSGKLIITGAQMDDVHINASIEKEGSLITVVEHKR